ncbi:hypothetical protein NOCA2170048 [metagenome]|uniref:DUF5667 domain-containing protein n=1 Tax=metagenome TaxID=256318 RepID=A0A2P2BXK4_9ZZZZ
MTSLLPSRRHAETFHALLEGIVPSTGAPAPYAGMLALVGGLRALDPPRPGTSFVTDLRTALFAAADEVLVQLTGAAAHPVVESGASDPGHRSQRRIAIIAGTVTLVGATASVTYAADSALPGDLLYPLKRTLEGAETGLASGPGRTDRILGNAGERLDEVSRLSTSGSVEEQALVSATLEDFSTLTTTGADRALASGDVDQLRALRTFTASSLTSLTSLESVIPESGQAALASAATLVTRYDAEAAADCATCPGAVLDLPAVFLLKVPAQIVPTDPLDPRSDATASTTRDPRSSLTPGQPHQDSPPNGPVPGENTVPGSDIPVVPEPSNPVDDALEDLGNTVLPGLPEHSGGVDEGPLAPIVTPITDPLQEVVDDTLDGVDDTLGNLLGGP